jgi:PAS domain S-box-containing protein
MFGDLFLDPISGHGGEATGRQILVDQDGFYLAHHLRDKEWGGPIDLNTGESVWSAYGESIGPVFSGHSGTLLLGTNVAAYHQITPNPSEEKRFWVLVHSVPEGVALSPLWHFRLALASVLGVSILGAVILSLYLSERLSGPLREMARGAQLFGRGVFGHRVRAQTGDETEVLADAFNQMAGRLAETQEIAHIGSWGWDIASGEMHWSDETYRIFGQGSQESEPTYATFLTSVHPDDRASVRRSAEEALAEGEQFGMDHRVVLPSGDVRVVHQQAEVTRDESGRAVRVVGTAQDITERERAERELREYRDHLEQVVAERTAEPAEAKDRAEEADRLKSTFLATMSHELRTPLNSIIGSTGIVLQGLAGPLTEEQTRQLGMAQASGRHLLSLINDVLDLSKIEAGELEVVSGSFDMGEVVESVVRTMAPAAEEKGLALSTQVQPEVGTILNDRRRVEQVLANLVGNAVKFTEKGSVRVECEISEGRLVTRVIDTGIGIRPEDMGQLFEAFQQIDSGSSRRHEGTGLGLSISRRLIEILGGDIWAESEWGTGSIFTFRLPVDMGGSDGPPDPRH